MIKLLLFSTLLSFLNPLDFELNIYESSVKGDTLTLKYSIKNNTNSLRTVFSGNSFSTIPEFSSFTLLIISEDSTFLHIDYFLMGSSHPHYSILDPRDSICSEIEVQLNRLYTWEGLYKGYPYKLKGRYSFQLIYYDKLALRADNSLKAQKGGRILKKHVPISDSLYSNIIYIDRK